MKKSELRNIIREEIKIINGDKWEQHTARDKWESLITGEKTINKSVLKKANDIFPNAKIKKKNVPAVGYVYYYYNDDGVNIGMASVCDPFGAVINRLKKQ